MAELLSGTVEDTCDKVLEKPGGVISFNIDSGNVKVDQQKAQKVCKTVPPDDVKIPALEETEEQVWKSAIAGLAKDVCITAFTLGAFYISYQLFRPVIDAAVKKALGRERDDQEVIDIRQRSLYVPIRCSTDKRFLEVLTIYESGKMKERFQEELLQAGIKAEEVKVEIKNKEAVNKTKQAIEKRLSVERNICTGVKNIAIHDAESDLKKKMENLKSMNESLNESKWKKDKLELTVTQLSYPVRLPGRQIITMGGMNADQNVLSSVSTFDLAERTYADLPPMNYPRYEAASCVYNTYVAIVGGSSDGSHGLNSIEILKINQHPLKWTIFEDILPFKLSGHVLTVYQEKLLVIGGYNWDRQEISTEIYELPLTEPYTPTFLVRMLQPRNMHRAEIVNGNLFILGGRSTNNPEDGLGSVIKYNPTRKTFIECAPLPQPVSGMSTVTWRNKIIVIGGEDINGRALNDVIMYDTESGQSERLPSLKHQRSGHSAVIIDNVVVVLEGRNKERYLDSGEIFMLETDQWTELPEMTKRRYGATAVVKP